MLHEMFLKKIVQLIDLKEIFNTYYNDTINEI